MTDDLVKRLRDYTADDATRFKGKTMTDEAADAIEALTAERDEAINQLDSTIHSQIVLEKRTAAVMEDRKFILEERDRTFALMLARAQAAEAERNKAILGNHRFTEHQPTWAELTNDWKARAEAAEAERDRLREAIMFWLEAKEPDVDAAIALMRAALKGDSHE